MAVTIPAICLERLLADAADAPEREICGLLFGTPERIDEARPAGNVAADPGRTFEIDPRDLIAAHRAERAGGARLIGHYHSHPSGDPTPSARDLAAAEPGRLWLILGGGVARAWQAVDGGFREAPLHVV